MDEMSRKVQNANTHLLDRKNHEHETCTAVGQFKGQFKGAMDESSRKVQNASSHPIILRTHKAHGQISGALDDTSRQVQKASAHRQHILL
jgi:flagellar hook-basal body complex protein FliE